jgi:hypothetical protein
MQGGLKIEICLLARLEIINGPLSFLIGQLQTPHQLLSRCNLSLCNPPIRFADMAEGGKNRSEESISRTVNASQVAEEPIRHVTQENAKNGTGNTTPQQANYAANHFAPDICGNRKTLLTHLYPYEREYYDRELRKYIIDTQPGTVKKEK